MAADLLCGALEVVEFTDKFEDLINIPWCKCV